VQARCWRLLLYPSTAITPPPRPYHLVIEQTLTNRCSEMQLHQVKAASGALSLPCLRAPEATSSSTPLATPPPGRQRLCTASIYLEKLERLPSNILQAKATSSGPGGAACGPPARRQAQHHPTEQAQQQRSPSCTAYMALETHKTTPSSTARAIAALWMSKMRCWRTSGATAGSLSTPSDRTAAATTTIFQSLTDSRDAGRDTHIALRSLLAVVSRTRSPPPQTPAIVSRSLH
jgi:hypothetical protein